MTTAVEGYKAFAEQLGDSGYSPEPMDTPGSDVTPPRSERGRAGATRRSSDIPRLGD